MQGQLDNVEVLVIISAAFLRLVTAIKFEGIRNKSTVLSSLGRNAEAINPQGFTGFP